LSATFYDKMSQQSQFAEKCSTVRYITILCSIYYYLCQQGGGYVIILSVCDLFCHFVNRITDKRGNRRRPNLAGVGKG